MSEGAESIKHAGELARFFDAHAHLSFAPEPEQFAAWLTERFSGAFSTTVTPDDFYFACKAFAHRARVKVGVGAHPWWISQGKLTPLEVEAAARDFARTRFIGEVGLDFGKNGMRDRVFATDEATKEAQVSALRTIFAACVGEPDNASTSAAHGRVFSFHAVQSADVIMDLLEEYGLLPGNTAIFHWFSGSSAQLQRARELGCSFSVNSFMLSTKRGREYAKAIPLKQLLIETDLPEEIEDESAGQNSRGNALADVERSYERHLISAYSQIYELRGVEALAAIEQNVARIFG